MPQSPAFEKCPTKQPRPLATASANMPSESKAEAKGGGGDAKGSGAKGGDRAEAKVVLEQNIIERPGFARLARLGAKEDSC